MSLQIYILGESRHIESFDRLCILMKVKQQSDYCVCNFSYQPYSMIELYSLNPFCPVFLRCSHLSTLRRFIELKTIWYIESDRSINYNCAAKSRKQSYQGRAARGESSLSQMGSRREETGLAVNSEAALNWNW